VRWATFSTLGSALLSTLSTVLVARVLTVEHMGLAALALLITGLCEIVLDLGLGAAVVKRVSLTDEYLNAVFWLSSLFSVLMFGAIVLLANAIGTYLNQPELAQLLNVCSVVLIIGAARIVPFHLLARELEFNKRAIAELVATALGTLVTLALLFLNFSYWSIILGLLTRHLVLSVMIMRATAWRPSLAVDRSSVWPALVDGLPLAGSRVLWYIYTKSSFLIVGRMLSPTSLGYFTTASTIVDIFAARLGGVINLVSFPVFSKLQEHSVQRRSAYLQVTRLTAVVMTPTLLGIALVADLAVSVVLTNKWLPMTPVLQAFCVLGLATAVTSLTPWMLVSLQRQRNVLLFDATCALLIPLSVLVFIKFGMVAAVLAHAFTYLLLITMLSHRLFRIINVTWREYSVALSPALGIALVIAFCVSAVKHATQDVSDAVSLVLCIFAGIICTTGYLWLAHRPVLLELTSLIPIRRLAPRRKHQ